MRCSKMKTLLIGAGKLLDFSSSYNAELRKKYLETDSSVLDRDALQSDWVAVGRSLRNALDKYEKADSRTVRQNNV